MLKPSLQTLLTRRVFFFFLLLTFVSCHTLDPHYKTQENLDLSIEAFNFEFESKALESSARFVHPSFRSKYMAKSLEITQRVTFFEATNIETKFFKNDVPAVLTLEGPEEGFTRAIVTIRYQVAVLPRTKLKTLLVEQEWVLHQGQWVVIPDLKTLLE